MEDQEIIYQIALTMVPGVGMVNAKNLISYCGSAKAVFTTKRGKLEKIPNIGPITSEKLCKNKDILENAEEELTYLQKHGIKSYFYTDPKYPKRLKTYSDAPILLFYKGNADLNTSKVLSVVGTRNATRYGRHFCQQLARDLAKHNILMVSGLAFGIDYATHDACVKEKIPTVGVMANGLHRVYPSQHHTLVQKMIQNGGLLSELPFLTEPERMHFPMRNRIIAGMCDALLVVETANKGGSMISAEMAYAYKKALFAVPGNVDSPYSKGCNALILNQKAQMICSAEDILKHMTWDQDGVADVQRSLFIDLNEDEQAVFDLLNLEEGVHIDELAHKAHLSLGILSMTLLNLEMKGLVQSLPGKFYIKIG